jgi:spore coat polysaccharide biosynthesis protein SpsF
MLNTIEPIQAPTEQEVFWSGCFGDEYTERNRIAPESRAPFFRQILDLAPDIQSVCEIGANTGHNLLALRSIKPALEITGVELNSSAFAALSGIPGIAAVQSAVQNFECSRRFDLVFTCGVLIHLNPADLPAVYRKMAALADKYVLINEYFNPVPVAIDYRDHSGKLFKRDFAGEFLDTVDGFEPAGWGFLWKRMEPAWDNSNWTLLRRVARL